MLMELKISVDQEILEYVNLLNCCVFSLSYMQVAPSMVVTRRRLQSYLVPSFSSIVATGVCVCVLKSIMVSVEGYHVSLSWVRSMLSAHFGVPHPLVLWWWCICCVSLVASRLVWCVIVACCICEFASDSVVEASSNLVFFGKLVNGSFSLTGLVFPEDGSFSCPVLYMSPRFMSVHDHIETFIRQQTLG